MWKFAAALLTSPKAGRLGRPTSWHLPPLSCQRRLLLLQRCLQPTRIRRHDRKCSRVLVRRRAGPLNKASTFAAFQCCLSAWLYRPDIFHNFHLGMAATCCRAAWSSGNPSSALVSLGQKLFTQCRNLGGHKVDFHGVLDWPEPGWQKGSTSTLLSESRCGVIVA